MIFLSLLDHYVQSINNAKGFDAANFPDQTISRELESCYPEVFNILNSATLGSQTALDAILHTHQESRGKDYNWPPLVNPAALAATVFDRHSAFESQRSFNRVFFELATESIGNAIYEASDESFIYQRQNLLSYQAERFLFVNDSTLKFEEQLRAYKPSSTINVWCLQSALNTLCGIKNEPFPEQWGTQILPGLFRVFKSLPKFETSIRSRKVRAKMGPLSWHLLDFKEKTISYLDLPKPKFLRGPNYMPKYWVGRLRGDSKLYQDLFRTTDNAVRLARSLLRAAKYETTGYTGKNLGNLDGPNLSSVGKILLAECIVIGQELNNFLDFFCTDEEIFGSNWHVNGEFFLDLRTNAADISIFTSELTEKFPELTRYVDYLSVPSSGIDFCFNNDSLSEICERIEAL